MNLADFTRAISDELAPPAPVLAILASERSTWRDKTLIAPPRRCRGSTRGYLYQRQQVFPPHLGGLLLGVGGPGGV